MVADIGNMFLALGAENGANGDDIIVEAV